MQGYIKVTPSQLISTADSFNTSAGKVRSITDNMLSIVNGLKGVWEGEAATTYTGKFNQLEDDMQKMNRMIQEHVKDLNEMAREYENAETISVETGSALANDVIS